VLKKATIKSYDAAQHKATVQIAGSLGVWLESLRVATNIPAADVVAGRQCAVLFLDPSNQDDAVVICVHGELPSVGQILATRATASLTLTTSYQSITGDGDSSKVRLLLPTPGDWLVEATVDFEVTAADPNECIAALFVNDAGAPETGEVIFGEGQVNRGTVAQRWKVTTTAANTPVELKARKYTDAGAANAKTQHTALTATGVQRPTTGPTTDHGELTGLGDDDHPQYGALAHTETWQALQTFSGGIKVATIQPIGATIALDDIDLTHSELRTGDNAIDLTAATGGMYPGISLTSLGRAAINSDEDVILALGNTLAPSAILFSQPSAGLLTIDATLSLTGALTLAGLLTADGSVDVDDANYQTRNMRLYEPSDSLGETGWHALCYQPLSGNKASILRVAPSGTAVNAYLELYTNSTWDVTGRVQLQATPGAIKIGGMSGGANFGFQLVSGGSEYTYFYPGASRFYGALLVGANAAPESGYALELRDDFLLGPYFQELREMTAPDAPAANGVRLYAEDNGSGKTRLMARFATGAAQQLAIEP
jgi:hypothetical protein